MELSPYAASWRDGDGAVVASVYGGTACLAPRNPRSFAAETDDGRFATIMRCRDCDGCRRYEMLLLRRRLWEHFREFTGELWAITVISSDQVEALLKLPFSLMRRLPNCAGMIRKGCRGLVLLAAGSLQTRAVLRSIPGLLVHAKRLALKRGGRAFADCVSGMMIPRSDYGRQVNRFYCRGLPALPRETFIVSKRGGIRKSHPEAKAGLRAWRAGLTLYASERTRVTEWLAAMRSWRSQRLEPSSTNRAPRGARRPSSSQATDRIAVAGSPSGNVSASPEHASRRRRRAATSFPTDQTEISQAGRDASSQSELPLWAAGFVARMTELARKRGP